MSAPPAALGAGAGLRPMSLGEILDRTFQIYRARFLACIAIGVAPAGIMLLLYLSDLYWWHLSRLLQPFRQPALLLWNGLLSLGSYHVAILVHAVFAGALVHQASSASFGEPCSARTSLRFAFARWRSFLWVGVLVLVVVLVGAEAVTAGIFAGLGSSMDALGLLNDGSNAAIAIVLIVPSIIGIALFLWLTGCCAFMLPACAFETVSPRGLLRRSWTLSRQGRWKIAVTFLLLLLLGWMVAAGVQGAWGWIVNFVWRAWPSGHHLLRIVYWPSGYVIAEMLGMVFQPLFPIAVTLFYYDQRIRKEGFDIEHLMQSAGMAAAAEAIPPQPETAAAPETASAEGWGA